MGSAQAGMSLSMVIAAMAIFFLITLGVGIVVSKFKLIKELEDYLVSGHSLPWPLMTAVLVGGWIYTSSTMGAAESALYFGAGGVWMYAVFGISLFCMIFVIGRFRKIADFLKISSITEYIHNRFNDNTHWAALAIIWSGSVVTLVLNILGAGFVVRGLSLGAVPFWVAVVAIGVITLIYVLWGGYWATSISSWVLMLICTFAVLSVVPFVVAGSGGVTKAVELVQATDPSMLNLFNPDALVAFLPGCILYGFASWAVQEWYQPGISCDGRGLRMGYFMAFIWIVVITAISGCIGFIGYALVSSQTIAAPNAPSEIMPHLVALYAPNWVSFLMLFLVFGAGSSTVALTAMAQATMLKGAYKRWCDIKGKEINSEADMQSKVKYYIIAIVLLSMAFGVVFEPSVLNMVLLADGIFSPLGIALFLSMFWNKVNPNGVFWGAVLGIIGVLATFWTISPGVAFMVGTAVGTGVTLLWTLISPQTFNMQKIGL